MCAATKGGLSLAGVDVTKEAVVQGRVLRGGNPVAGHTCGCSTRVASSPRRSRHRRPVTSGFSPLTATGPSARLHQARRRWIAPSLRAAASRRSTSTSRLTCERRAPLGEAADLVVARREKEASNLHRTSPRRSARGYGEGLCLRCQVANRYIPWPHLARPMIPAAGTDRVEAPPVLVDQDTLPQPRRAAPAPDSSKRAGDDFAWLYRQDTSTRA